MSGGEEEFKEASEDFEVNDLAMEVGNMDSNDDDDDIDIEFVDANDFVEGEEGYDDNMDIEKKENNNNTDDDFFSISSGQHEIETPSDAQSPSSPGINGKPQVIMGSMLAGNGSDDGSSVDDDEDDDVDGVSDNNKEEASLSEIINVGRGGGGLRLDSSQETSSDTSKSKQNIYKTFQPLDSIEFNLIERYCTHKLKPSPFHILFDFFFVLDSVGESGTRNVFGFVFALFDWLLVGDSETVVVVDVTASDSDDSGRPVLPIPNTICKTKKMTRNDPLIATLINTIAIAKSYSANGCVSGYFFRMSLTLFLTIMTLSTIDFCTFFPVSLLRKSVTAADVEFIPFITPLIIVS